jgi:hypothetical protein
MRRTTILAATAALGGLLICSPAAQAGIRYTFADIDVPGSQLGTTGEFGLALNNLGQVAGSYTDNAGNSDGFLYTNGKYVTIDAPGAINTFVYGLNDWGQILGVSSFSNGNSYVFLDTHGTFTNIANANDFYPYNNALNDRDQVLGQLSGGNGGVLNPNGVITAIDLSGAPGQAYASGFNNFDQFTGTISDSVGEHAFIGRKGSYTIIDDPNVPPGNTFGDGINDWGQVVGEYYDPTNGDVSGFLYTNGHFTTVDDPNAYAPIGTEPLVINDLDQIAGWYYDSQYNAHVFLATDPPAVPEPSTWAMLALGFGVIGFAGAWRGRTRRLAI